MARHRILLAAALLVSGCPAPTGETSDTNAASSESTGNAPGCGNGVVEDDEQCDDANDALGDGCNPDCRLSATQVWSFDYDDGFPRWTRAIALDAEGLPIVGGQKQINSENAVRWIAKFDTAGALLWEVEDDTPGPLDGTYVSTLRVRESGSIVVAEVFGPFGYVRELDANGSELAVFGAYGPVHGLVVTDDDIFAGGIKLYSDAPDHWDDASLIRFGSEGEVWNVTYDGDAALADAIFVVERAPNGLLVVGGSADGLLDQDPFSIWLASYTADGELVWEVTDDGGGTTREIFGLTVSSDGSIFVTGWAYDAAGDPSTLLAKYDSDGTKLWEQILPDSDAGNAIVSVADGSIAVVGGRPINEYDGWLARFDTAGAPLWDLGVDGPMHGWDYGHDLAIAPTGELVVLYAIDYDAGPGARVSPRVTAYTP